MGRHPTEEDEDSEGWFCDMTGGESSDSVRKISVSLNGMKSPGETRATEDVFGNVLSVRKQVSGLFCFTGSSPDKKCGQDAMMLRIHNRKKERRYPKLQSIHVPFRAPKNKSPTIFNRRPKIQVYV